MTAQEIVDVLHLSPLAGEGGMYRSTYVSLQEADGAPVGSAIFYLLHGDAFSHLHRLTADEVWYWHAGAPLELTELCPDGSVVTTILGMDLASGQIPQRAVRAGNWMGASVAEGHSQDFVLVSTHMSPAWSETTSYTHGNREELITRYPQAAERICRLTGDAIFF